MRITLLDCDPEVVFGDGLACPPRLRGLAGALARAGHEVTAICAAHEPQRDAGAAAVAARLLRLPASVREIDWHFSSVQPELVVERLVPGAIEGARAAAEAGVLHLYDVDQQSTPRDTLAGNSAVRGALPHALEHSAGVVAACAAAAARVRAHYGHDMPVEIVTSAAGEALFETPSPDRVARLADVLRREPHVPFVGFHGPLERDSGVLAAVGALAQLPRERRPRLAVLGDGPERNPALRAAERAGVGLVLCGRVGPRELPAHLALCDVVISSGEAGGSVPTGLLEAMAAARAVIAPATEAVSAVARADRDACMVPAGDEAALAGAIAGLLADGPRRTRLGVQARQTARAHHTWDARAEQLLGFVRSLPARAAEATRPERSARRLVSG